MKGIIKLFFVTMIIGGAFYIFYPKHYFPRADIRCNKITGKVERLKNGKWCSVETEEMEKIKKQKEKISKGIRKFLGEIDNSREQVISQQDKK